MLFRNVGDLKGLCRWYVMVRILGLIREGFENYFEGKGICILVICRFIWFCD